MLSDSKDNHFSSSFKDFGARNEERIYLFSFFPARHSFFNSNGLSGHGRFVCDNIVALDEESINWDDFTGFNYLNISHQEFVNIDILDSIVSDDVDIFAGCDCI